MIRRFVQPHSHFLFLILITLTWTTIGSPSLADETFLPPLKTETPRDTLRSFMNAMNSYKKGVEENNAQMKSRLDEATRTLHLEKIPFVVREQQGREAAIFLKEVIDRLVVVDYEKVPDEKQIPSGRWRLKNTEIVISKVNEGERQGEYLFSSDSVMRARSFYKRIKNRPYLVGSGEGAAYKPPLLQRVLPPWAEKNLMGFLIWQWMGLFALILAGLIFKKLLQWMVSLFSHFTSKTESDLDDRVLGAIDKPIGLVGATAFWYFSFHLLGFENMVLEVLSIGLQVLLSVALIWMAYRMADVFSHYLHVVADKTDFELDNQVYPLISRAIKLFVIVLGTLISAQNLGVNVSSLIAGLGLGGLAFALAAQDTVGNLFGSIMILWDKPFRVGDWISSKTSEGIVEEIGFRSTRIRTFYDSQISIPNRELASAVIDNLGRRKYRRVMTTLGVAYHTPPEKIEAFVEGIKRIIQKHPLTRKDKYFVVFDGFGASSLNVLVYFFVEVPGWADELVARQNVFFGVLELAHDLGISFAFPSQSLYVESTPERPLPQNPPPSREELQKLIHAYGPEGDKYKTKGMGFYSPLPEQKT